MSLKTFESWPHPRQPSHKFFYPRQRSSNLCFFRDLGVRCRSISRQPAVTRSAAEGYCRARNLHFSHLKKPWTSSASYSWVLVFITSRRAWYAASFETSIDLTSYSALRSSLLPCVALMNQATQTWAVDASSLRRWWRGCSAYRFEDFKKYVKGHVAIHRSDNCCKVTCSKDQGLRFKLALHFFLHRSGQHRLDQQTRTPHRVS